MAESQECSQDLEIRQIKSLDSQILKSSNSFYHHLCWKTAWTAAWWSQSNRP